LHAKGIAPQRTGAIALDLTTGKVVFAHNSAVGFVPASNEKLPITFAALKMLGPGFRFPTEVRGQGSLGADGTWAGNLVLKGYGDPTLSRWNLLALAHKIRALGITHVTGMVVGEVQEELGIPASTLSHHLEKLKQVGLVHVRRESTYLWYSADTDALREVMNFLYEECCTRSRAVPAESVVQISGRTS